MVRQGVFICPPAPSEHKGPAHCPFPSARVIPSPWWQRPGVGDHPRPCIHCTAPARKPPTKAMPSPLSARQWASPISFKQTQTHWLLCPHQRSNDACPPTAHGLPRGAVLHPWGDAGVFTSAFRRSISISPSSICWRSCLATVFSVSTICRRWRYFCISASCSVARFL